MNFTEALDLITKNNKIRIRRKKYKLKIYKREYDGQIKYLNLRYVTFIKQALEKSIMKYEKDIIQIDGTIDQLSNNIVNELRLIKENMEKDFQNTWVKLDEFSSSLKRATDWEVVK